jgi:ABC-2 type transport system permease protein
MMPLDLFPESMRRLAHLTPHAWAVEGFAELVRHEATVVDILPQLGVLLGAATVILSLAAWRLRRSITT